MKVAGLLKGVWRFGTTWHENGLKRIKDQKIRSKSKPKSKSLRNIIFWNCICFSCMILNTRRFVGTGIAWKVMFSLRIFIVNASKSAGSFFLFRFLHVVNYKSVKWETFFADGLRRQNLKTLWVQVPWWNGKQTYLCCIFLFSFAIFFLLRWVFLWNHFFRQNVMINIFLPTHLKRQIDFLCDKMVMDVTHR